VKLSVKGMKSSEKFWRVVTNLSLFYNAFCYFMSVLNRVYRPCPSVVKKFGPAVLRSRPFVVEPGLLLS
jgi:hypothetical protein